MKLVAKTDRGFLAEITADEFSQIEGYRAEYDRADKKRSRLEVGAEVDVAAWASAARHVIDERSRVERLRDEYTNAAKRLDGVLEAIGPARIES